MFSGRFLSLDHHFYQSRQCENKADRVDNVGKEHPGLYQLIIEDNGCGGKETDGEEKAGIGICNMQDRVAALGGRIQPTWQYII